MSFFVNPLWVSLFARPSDDFRNRPQVRQIDAQYDEGKIYLKWLCSAKFCALDGVFYDILEPGLKEDITDLTLWIFMIQEWNLGIGLECHEADSYSSCIDT